MTKSCVSAAVLAATALATAANAGYTITQTLAATPTYGTVLNFDAPGSPTGSVNSSDFSSYGVTSLDSGVGPGGYVAQMNTTPGYSWLGTGNVFTGAYGAYMKFSTQVSSLSAQYWDDSGPGSFFGGGATVVLYKSGVEVGSLFINNPAFNSSGKSWINVTTTGGDTFDEINFVGFGSAVADAYIDNISWNKVPAPSATALLALGGLVAGRRRRA